MGRHIFDRHSRTLSPRGSLARRTPSWRSESSSAFIFRFRVVLFAFLFRGDVSDELSLLSSPLSELISSVHSAERTYHSVRSCPTATAHTRFDLTLCVVLLKISSEKNHQDSKGYLWIARDHRKEPWLAEKLRLEHAQRCSCLGSPPTHQQISRRRSDTHMAIGGTGTAARKIGGRIRCLGHRRQCPARCGCHVGVPRSADASGLVVSIIFAFHYQRRRFASRSPTVNAVVAEPQRLGTEIAGGLVEALAEVFRWRRNHGRTHTIPEIKQFFGSLGRWPSRSCIHLVCLAGALLLMILDHGRDRKRGNVGLLGTQTAMLASCPAAAFAEHFCAFCKAQSTRNANSGHGNARARCALAMKCSSYEVL